MNSDNVRTKQNVEKEENNLKIIQKMMKNGNEEKQRIKLKNKKEDNPGYRTKIKLCFFF